MLLAGELGLGSLSRDWMEVRMAETSYVGLHLKEKRRMGQLAAKFQSHVWLI